MSTHFAEHVVRVMLRNNLTPQALKILLFLKTPRRPQVMLDELGVDRGSLNKVVRRHSELMSRRVVKDKHVARGPGKLPIEYYLTPKGKRLVKSLETAY